MSNFLLDTHILIWYISGSSKLNTDAREAIAQADNLYFSSASWHELAILISLQHIETSIAQFESLASIIELKTISFDVKVAEAYTQVTLNNKDPFDKAIIATAKAYNLVLMSADQNICNAKIPKLKIYKAT
jgi:PIN domain nuclease of toxin-antitoxin system